MSTLIEFSWWPDAPSIYATETQLKQAGLKPGGPPVARVAYGRGRKAREYLLYNGLEAVPRKQATSAQLAALEQARIKQRTCWECGGVVERPSDLSPRGRCPDCLAAFRRLKRARERDATIVWARELLRRDDWLILDTETTHLNGLCVEIGIIDACGETVFESLVQPLAEIDPGAEAIHGISRQMLWGAPTFAELEPELRRILHGKTVVAYNAAYDAGVLEREVARMCTPPEEVLDLFVIRELRPSGWQSIYQYPDPRDAFRNLAYAQARWWVGRSTWECAMEQYATYYGEPYYRGGYAYQSLGGGHRAVGDCRACLDLIRSMAATPLSWDVPLPKDLTKLLYYSVDEAGSSVDALDPTARE